MARSVVTPHAMSRAARLAQAFASCNQHDTEILLCWIEHAVSHANDHNPVEYALLDGWLDGLYDVAVIDDTVVFTRAAVTLH